MATRRILRLPFCSFLLIAALEVHATARELPRHRLLYEQPDMLHGECTNATLLLEGHTPPLAASRPRVLTAKFDNNFVDRRTDPYFWLRDDTRTNPEVLAYLEAENSYTAAVMAPTDELQDAFYDEMKARIPPEETNPAQQHDGFWYYDYRVASGQYPVYARRKLPPGAGPPGIHDEMDTKQPEQVLLDQNAIIKAAGSSFLAIGGTSIPRNGAWLAYSLDLKGDEVYKLYVRNISWTGDKPVKGQTYGPVSNVAGGGIAWANDNSTFFCVTLDATKRASVLWRYSVSSRGLSQAALLYNETDPAFNIGLEMSRSGRHIFLYSSSSTTSSVMMLDADKPTTSWLTLGARVHERQIQQVAERGGQLFMLVSDPARRNGELLVAPAGKPTRTSVLIDHDVEVKLEGFALSECYLTMLKRDKGAVAPIVYELPADIDQEVTSLDKGRTLALPEDGAEVFFEDQGPFISGLARIRYSSLVTPPSTFDFDLATGERVTKQEQEVVGGYDRDAYQAERIWSRSPDGVEVPISLVYRKDLIRYGGKGSPTLLQGYGAYGIAIDPYFDSNRLSILDRGFIWAFAHIRGGGELGAYWYQAGKLLQKRNTFIDFIAAAEHLIKEGYTSEERLAIEGRSAGGLTVGAPLNMRPGLFKAAVMGVPFVDALTTERDPTLPLTVGEWEEWGDPLHNKTAYEYMKSYSPYDNIREQAYPHMLVTAGLSDPRVSYWEPAKLVAKIRSLSTSRHMLLFKCHMEGHFGSSGIYDHLREVALKYAFLLHALSACPDDGSGDGEPLRDNAFIAAVALGIVILLGGAVIGACFWSRTRRGQESVKEVTLRTFPQRAGFAKMEFESPVPEQAGDMLLAEGRGKQQLSDQPQQPLPARQQQRQQPRQQQRRQ